MGKRGSGDGSRVGCGNCGKPPAYSTPTRRHRSHATRHSPAGNGPPSPTWETVLAICSALGVSCEDFRQQPAEAPRKGPGRPPKAKPPIEEPAPKKRRKS